MIMEVLGEGEAEKTRFVLVVTSQTRYLTHPPNRANLANPTPAMVGGGSQIPKSEIGRSVDGLEHGKLISTDPIRKHTKNSFLRKLK